MKLVLSDWVKAARVHSLHQKGHSRGLPFFRQSTMLQFPVGLIHKENASFATVTFLLLRPCNCFFVWICLFLSHMSDNAHKEIEQKIAAKIGEMSYG